MRVASDEHINPSIPRWNDAIQFSAEARRVRATVDQHAAARNFNQDRIALPNI
jgi:hypothetical protein